MQASEQATEIKQAFEDHGVDGRALSNLTLDDVEKIGETTGVVEGGEACALRKVGHRIALLSELDRFRNEHRTKTWAQVIAAVNLDYVSASPRGQSEPLSKDLANQFGVGNFSGDNGDAALKAATVHKSRPAKGKDRTEVVVPVYATLVVKKIVEDTDGNLDLVSRAALKKVSRAAVEKMVRNGLRQVVASTGRARARAGRRLSSGR